MKLKKLRNALLFVLTLALVSATAVAATWAVVNKAAEEKENTFTTPNIALQISEDKWDGRDYGNDTAAIPSTGNVTLPHSGGTLPAVDLGYNTAQKYNPDQVINKNPSLKNSSATPTTAQYMSGITNKEWVGMKVDYRVKAFNGNTALLYTINEGAASAIDDSTLSLTNGWYSFPSRAAFETAIAQIGDSTTVDPSYTSKTFSAPAASNTADTWVTRTGDPEDNGKKFYYTSKVAPGGTTTNLFNYVHIKKDWNTVTVGGTTYYEIMTVGTGASAVTYYATGLPDFDIVLKGYAVQADEVDWADAPAALSALMDSNA